MALSPDAARKPNAPAHSRRRVYVVRPIALALYKRPRCADDPPEIVVEILSPGDEQDDVDEKRDVLLACGVSLVLVVEPELRTLDAYDRNGGRETVGAVETYSPDIFPGSAFPLREMFDELEIPDA